GTGQRRRSSPERPPARGDAASRAYRGRPGTRPTIQESPNLGTGSRLALADGAAEGRQIGRARALERELLDQLALVERGDRAGGDHAHAELDASPAAVAEPARDAVSHAVDPEAAIAVYAPPQVDAEDVVELVAGRQRAEARLARPRGRAGRGRVAAVREQLDVALQDQVRLG